MRSENVRNSLLLGFLVGSVFGAVDLLMTVARPLDDDSPWALLRFYGPMFLVWTLVAFRTARRTSHLWSGIAAGTVVAFATFCAFVFFNFLRVNLFLDQLAARSDWQDMMQRFRGSGIDSLRQFVNLDYLKGTPFKIAAATLIGGLFGTVGATLGLLGAGRR